MVTDLVLVSPSAQAPAQIALAWLLHHSPRTLLIPGTANLEANLAAGAIVLDEEALAALDAVPVRPSTPQAPHD